MSLTRVRSTARRLFCWAAAICATTIFAPTANAAFHLWAITEVYTNSSGLLQYIEMQDAFSNENFVNGQGINVINLANTQTNMFTIPGGPLPGDTANRFLLFGTAGIQAAGGPAPDYIIPDGFLFSAGGTINFFGMNSGPYTALPTDGAFARLWNGGDAINSPTNYAGITGFVNGVPEPSTLILSSLAAGGIGMYRRRSRSRAAAPPHDAS